MDTAKAQAKKGGTGVLIFLCWIVYTTSYLGKVNYSANITQIIDYYNITKAQAGIAPTFFFFSYGIGQVINGLLCKKYNIKWMIFSSLTVSAIINLIIAVSSDFSIVKWLWLVNGIVLSTLWPTIIRLITEVLPQKDLGKSSVIMGTTVATGTLVIYGLSSLYAVFDKFKYAFFTAAYVGLFVSLCWLLLYNKIVKMAQRNSDDKPLPKEDKQIIEQKPAMNIWEKRHFYMVIGVLIGCAIATNLIKDGLTTWVPSILKDEYAMADSLSILLTLFLPIVAIFGNFFALRVHIKIPDYISHCAAIFAIMLGFILFIIGSLTFKVAVFLLIGLIVVNFLASSLNSLITSIFPMFMRGKVNSGLCAGILNGFCYVGSTISSYGLGAIADNFGWISVFWVFVGCCSFLCLVWCVYIYLKHRWERKSKE